MGKEQTHCEDALDRRRRIGVAKTASEDTFCEATAQLGADALRNRFHDITIEFGSRKRSDVKSMGSPSVQGSILGDPGA